MAGDALGAGAADEEAAGEVFLEVAFDAGGDIEVFQVRAAEGAGGGLDAGEVDLLQHFLSGGVIADDFGAVAEGDPEAVFAVDGHAIRTGGVGAGVPDDAFAADGAGGVVEVKGADLFAGGINVIHGAGIGAPDDAVGIGDGTEFLFDGEVGVEAVEGGIGALFQADGAGPKAACGITFAVVKTVVREVGLGVGNEAGGAGGFIQGEEALIARPKEAAGGAWDDGADALADIPDGFCAGGGVKGEDFMGLDVHIKEAVLMPDRAFSPSGDVFADGFRSDHVRACLNSVAWVASSDAPGAVFFGKIRNRCSTFWFRRYLGNPMFRTQLSARLQAAFDAAGIVLPEGFSVTVGIASDTRFGDYQSNAAMVLAKQLKTNPRALAQQVVDQLKVEDLCSKVSIDGPGFLNFTLSAEALAARLALILKDEKAGVPAVAEPKRIVVDFSAPNIAKPMHVGHIRSTMIGDSLARVARFVGHTVITDNHIGDWGTQFGMILHGWKTILNEEALKADPIHELVRVYKDVNAQTKADAAVLDTCRQELVKLQQGNAENLEIWKQCVALSLEQLRRIYGKLGVHFDHFLGESYYNDKLAPLVETLLASGIAEVSEGAVCVFFREVPELADKPCIIRKSDGGFLYATTDLATIDYRLQEWQADEVWYVVGAPQELHFRQIFQVAQKRGQTAKLQHIAFGSILGQDGKMFRTRTGESVGLIEVLDEAYERARAVVAEREGLTDTEKDEIAEIIGTGAVKYAELSQHRMTDYKFSWDKMLALQGNTAPYLINAYVRTRSIFRKLDGAAELTEDLAITEPAERALAMKLAQLAEVTHDILGDYRPNLLATYLFELAETFHSFYEACHVLRTEGTVRNTRLSLCEAASKVLKTGLGLLGIRTTERM